MTADRLPIEGGFADPVFDSQATFSKAMHAFSRPGSIVDLGTIVLAPPPLATAAAAFLATLGDFETAVWLDPSLRDADVIAWIGFNVGASVTDKPGLADLGILSTQFGDWETHGFAVGTSEYPDRSVTLIAQIGSLEGGPALMLSGPGIESQTHISPQGLPIDFAARWAANNSQFPLGIDLVLVADSRLMVLPRTTRVRKA